MADVWLVMGGNGGEYSDFRCWPVAVFPNEMLAEQYIAKCEEWLHYRNVRAKAADDAGDWRRNDDILCEPCPLDPQEGGWHIRYGGWWIEKVPANPDPNQPHTTPDATGGH